MSYKKMLVDNVGCSRRFHVSFDDEATNVPRTEVRCQFCNEVVFSAENHPPVKLAREENLVKTSQLSDTLMSSCSFTDKMGTKS